MRSAVARWTRFQLTDRIDGAAFAVFRMAMGAMLLYDALDKGLHFFAPNAGRDFTFRYEYFHWLPEEAAWAFPLQLLWIGLSVLIILGLFYRVSCILVTLLLIYGFLLGEEFYLNHYYLLILVTLMMCIIPMHRTWSLDAAFLIRPAERGTMRRLYLTMMKAQIEIVLIYAGLVKLNWDWLRLEPIRTWLISRSDAVWYGGMWETEAGLLLGAFFPVVLHLVGAPLLLWRRTRLPVFLLYLVFHVTNHFIFNIGIFPWMTIALTTLFFDPDWPRRLLQRAGLAGLAFAQDGGTDALHPAPLTAGARLLVVFALLWTLSQALLPLRHFLIAGEARWTDEGHRFAWRMKLLDRRTTMPVMLVYMPERGELRVPFAFDRLSRRQMGQMGYHPGMLRRYAIQLADSYRSPERPDEDIRVHAWVMKSVNYRKMHLFIDPTVDLVTARYRFFGHDDWVVAETPHDIRRYEEVVAEDEALGNPHLNFPPLTEILRQAGLPEVGECRMNEAQTDLVCPIAEPAS